MRVRKFNPLLYEKLKDAQGGGYFRALRASSSYTLKKKFLRNSEGKLYLSLFEKGHFCVGGVLKSQLTLTSTFWKYVQNEHNPQKNFFCIFIFKFEAT